MKAKPSRVKRTVRTTSGWSQLGFAGAADHFGDLRRDFHGPFDWALPLVDPAPFRVLRFEDGSPIKIGPEI
jgi:hypothetical protein